MPKGFSQKDIEYKTQVFSEWEEYTNDQKLELSQEILNYYKDNAKIVITSRFHCAMPCIAMGIPVVFLGDKNSKRCEGLNKYITVYDYVHFGFRTRTHLKKLNWSDYVPLFNKKIKYDFNMIDVMYNLFCKVYLHICYFLRLKKINWDIHMPDIEKQKHDMMKAIEKNLEKVL